MINYLLDTNICGLILEQKPKKVIEHLQEIGNEFMAMSTITVGEFEYGYANSNTTRPKETRRGLNQLYGLINPLFFDDVAAYAYGEVRFAVKSTYDKNFIDTIALDMFIAAHAKSLGYTLVSTDGDMVKIAEVIDLPFENWEHL